MDFDELAFGEKLALAGGALAGVAALLPWGTIETAVGGGSTSGLSGDGVLTLIAGVVVVWIVATREWETREMAAVGGLGALTALIGWNIHSNITSLSVAEASVGIGVYLTLLAGLLMIAGPAYTYHNRDENEISRTRNPHGTTQQHGGSTQTPSQQYGGNTSYNQPRENTTPGNPRNTSTTDDSGGTNTTAGNRPDQRQGGSLDQSRTQADGSNGSGQQRS